ncbi:MAG: dTMP kinase [Melioribacteraceae bacterium]|nr:dTMP kinase [Melioribacteraceae bacterium]
MFITFEGLDFCGKSTQVNLLKEYLESKNQVTKIIREPGGTIISEEVRDILLNKKHSKMVKETELLLFSASRAQLVREIILPALGKGIYVISDRFHDSLTAYQGYGRGISLDFINDLNSFVLEKAVPDLTFFIDIPLEEVANRKAKMENLELDRIEVSDNSFYERVREGFIHFSETKERFVRIDGLRPVEEIHSEIIGKIENWKK